MAENGRSGFRWNLREAATKRLSTEPGAIFLDFAEGLMLRLPIPSGRRSIRRDRKLAAKGLSASARGVRRTRESQPER